jgi:hypothetical protein
MVLRSTALKAEYPWAEYFTPLSPPIIFNHYGIHHKGKGEHKTNGNENFDNCNLIE